MKTFITLLLSFITTASTAATYFHELPDDMYIGTRLKIYPQCPGRHAPPAYMRFVVNPFHDSATATLVIEFTHPKTRPDDLIAYHLRRGGVDYIAENYLQRHGDRITLNLPSLKRDELIEFLVGWRGEEFPYQKVAALLTTEHGKKTASWTSRDMVNIFPPGR